MLPSRPEALMGDDRVAIDVIDRVLIVRMVRESKRNAIDRAGADALDAAFNRLDDDDELWAGVLTGTSSVFCAGSDVTARGDYVTSRGGEYGLMRRVRTKPLVAAVEGVALGGGLELVLACDLVVASRAALFGLPEVCIGGVPTSGALFRGPRALPINIARELLLTGEPLPAERAHLLGFANVLTDAGSALDAAVALAHRICANAPLAVRSSKAALVELESPGDIAGWQATAAAHQRVADSDDLREGVTAFLNRRVPVWRAR